MSPPSLLQANLGTGPSMTNNFRAKVFNCLNSFVMTGGNQLRKDKEGMITHQHVRTESLPLMTRSLPAFSSESSDAENPM